VKDVARIRPHTGPGDEVQRAIVRCRLLSALDALPADGTLLVGHQEKDARDDGRGAVGQRLRDREENRFEMFRRRHLPRDGA
jgi:hypothetical protein